MHACTAYQNSSEVLIFLYDQVKIHDTIFMEKLCRLAELQHVLEATLVHFLHFRNHHMPAIQPIETNQEAICDLEQRGGGRGDMGEQPWWGSQ